MARRERREREGVRRRRLKGIEDGEGEERTAFRNEDKEGQGRREGEGERRKRQDGLKERYGRKEGTSFR